MTGFLGSQKNIPLHGKAVFFKRQERKNFNRQKNCNLRNCSISSQQNKLQFLLWTEAEFLLLIDFSTKLCEKTGPGASNAAEAILMSEKKT